MRADAGVGTVPMIHEGGYREGASQVSDQGIVGQRVT